MRPQSFDIRESSEYLKFKYEYTWHSYSMKFTRWIFILCKFGLDLVDFQHIFGIHSSIQYEYLFLNKNISFYWFEFILYFYFVKIQVCSYSYSAQKLIFDICVILHCMSCINHVCNYLGISRIIRKCIIELQLPNRVFWIRQSQK